MKRLTYAAVSVALALGSLTAPAGAESGPNQRFTIVFQNTQDEARIVAAGPIRGPGRVFFLDATDSPDGSFVETYRAEFRSGDLLLTVAGANESFDLDPRTCVLHMVNRGTFTVSDGTGDLTGISGQGSVTFRLTGVLQRTEEGCSDEGRFVGVAKLIGQVVASAAA